MEEEIFNEGDTVKLKSGGPIMVIYDTDEFNAWCTWFDKEGKIQTSALRKSILIKSTPEII